MSKKVWGARYTLGVRYLSKNTVIRFLTDLVSFPITLPNIIPSSHYLSCVVCRHFKV